MMDMKTEELIKQLEDLLELDEPLKEGSDIELDSFEVLGLIVLFDEEFSIKKSTEDFENIKNVNDIIEMIGKGKLN